MNLNKCVKRKTVEYNELVINREMLIELVRSQHIGVSDDVKIEFDGIQSLSGITIKMMWERSSGDG